MLDLRRPAARAALLLLPAVSALGCARAAQEARNAEEVEGLRERGARDLHCEASQVRTQRVAMYRNALYLAEGCGQRASYAPILTWPGPAETGFILIARFPYDPEDTGKPKALSNDAP